MKVYKTFRRRPGHLLNFLFSLISYLVFMEMGCKIQKFGWIFQCSLGFTRINPFHYTSLLLYHCKTSGNWRFFDVFRDYRNRSVALNWLIRENLLDHYRQCGHYQHSHKKWKDLFVSFDYGISYSSCKLSMTWSIINVR